MGFWDTVKNVGAYAIGGVPGLVANNWDKVSGDPGAAQEAERKRLLNEQSQKAGAFADQAQSGYGALGNEATREREYLRQLARGEHSVSALQLQQGLQQNLAAQRSLAAGASPQNAAMAARTAAIQAGRLGAGYSGQAALAGLQERNMASQQLQQAILGQRGQDLAALQGARGQAIAGYGAGNAGAPEKSWLEKYGPAIQGAAGLAMAASDRRLKKGIEDGDEDADRALEGLRAYRFKYKDEAAHGAGERVGIMAQDLERAGLRHAVVDTPGGKYVDGAQLSTANTAMIARLGERLRKLEKGGRGK